MGMLAQADPRTFMQLQGQFGQIDERKARTEAMQGKVSQEHRKTAYGIGVEALTAYDETLSKTNDPKLAAQKMAEVRAQSLDAAVADGSLSRDMAQRFPPPDPSQYRALKSAYEAQNTKPITPYQRVELGFREAADQRAQRAERREQARFARGDLDKPDDIEVTTPDGKKTITTGAWDKDKKQWVTTDGTMTPIEGNVRKVSPGANQASSEALDASAEQIANYNAPPLTSWAMARGQGPEIMKRVKEINPSYNAQQYQVALRVRNSFASGAQDAKQMDAMNTVVHHLGVFDEVAKSLQNHDVNAINRVVNYVKTELGHPEVTSFDAAKGLIADEVVQAVTGSGAVFDREGMQKLLSSDRSGEQFEKQGQILRRLMAGRMGAKYQRWNSAHLPDDEFVAKLEPETIEGIRSYVPSNLKKALGGEGEKDAGPSGAASETKFDMNAPAKKGEAPPVEAFGGDEKKTLTNEHGESYRLRGGKVVKVN
jgi:hypothetical protein